MWKKYAGYLKQILPLMKNSLLPVLLLGTALGTYFMLAPFGEKAQRFLHVGHSDLFQPQPAAVFRPRSVDCLLPDKLPQICPRHYL